MMYVLRFTERYAYNANCKCKSLKTSQRPRSGRPEYSPALSTLGAVHKVRHAIFGQFLPPSLLSHISGPPRKYDTHLGPPRFSVGLVQKTRTKVTLYKFCLNCSWWFLWGVVRGVFCLEGFVR